MFDVKILSWVHILISSLYIVICILYKNFCWIDILISLPYVGKFMWFNNFVLGAYIDFYCEISFDIGIYVGYMLLISLAYIVIYICLRILIVYILISLAYIVVYICFKILILHACVNISGICCYTCLLQGSYITCIC